MSSDPARGDIEQLWQDALEAYNKETKSDLFGCDFADAVFECKSAQDVIDVLQENMEDFKGFRSEDSKWGEIRNVLTRVVDVVLALNSVAGDAATAAVRSQPHELAPHIPLMRT